MIALLVPTRTLGFGARLCKKGVVIHTQGKIRENILQARGDKIGVKGDSKLASKANQNRALSNVVGGPRCGELWPEPTSGGVEEIAYVSVSDSGVLDLYMWGQEQQRWSHEASSICGWIRYSRASL